MKMKLKQLLFATAAFAVLVVLPAAAKADPVTLFVEPFRSVAAGASVTFMGSLSNAGMPSRFLDTVTINIAQPPGGGIAWDETLVYLSYPGAIPPPPQGLVSFFDVFVDLSVPTGDYLGSWSATLVDNMGLNTIIVNQAFTVRVQQGAPGAVPEPATMFLLATGLGGAALAKRRAKLKGKSETSS